MRYLTLIVILLLSNSFTIAQSKKKAKEYGITAKVEWQYEYRNGVETKFKESEFKFDEDGNIIMEKYYDENGNTIKHFEYSYNANGDVIAETAFNPKGQIISKEEYRYKGDLKVEKRVIGADGKLKSKKIYEYNQE
jgi:hypothetical protein